MCLKKKKKDYRKWEPLDVLLLRRPRPALLRVLGCFVLVKFMFCKKHNWYYSTDFGLWTGIFHSSNIFVSDTVLGFVVRVGIYGAFLFLMSMVVNVWVSGLFSCTWSIQFVSTYCVPDSVLALCICRKHR